MSSRSNARDFSGRRSVRCGGRYGGRENSLWCRRLQSEQKPAALRRSLRPRASCERLNEAGEGDRTLDIQLGRLRARIASISITDTYEHNAMRYQQFPQQFVRRLLFGRPLGVDHALVSTSDRDQSSHSHARSLVCRETRARRWSSNDRALSSHCAESLRSPRLSGLSGHAGDGMSIEILSFVARGPANRRARRHA